MINGIYYEPKGDPLWIDKIKNFMVFQVFNDTRLDGWKVYKCFKVDSVLLESDVWMIDNLNVLNKNSRLG